MTIVVSVMKPITVMKEFFLTASLIGVLFHMINGQMCIVRMFENYRATISQDPDERMTAAKVEA